jgi:hypothetical protein
VAVRLILVALVVCACIEASAQQSSETGGRVVDRRLNIRRFSARRKAEKEERPTRKNNGSSEEEIARRRLLFQRNRLNRNRGTAERVEDTEVPVTERRPVSVPRRQRPNVRPTTDIDPPIVRISNNNRDIQNLVLNNQVEDDEEERKPFEGTSVVGTISQPSGFRSLNEQLVRVSFKKIETPEKKDDALEALLRTANKKAEVTESKFIDESVLSVEEKAAVREMQEDEREEAALAARKKLRSQEDSEGRKTGSTRFRSFPRSQSGSQSSDRTSLPRLRVRGRGLTRTTESPTTTTTTTTLLQEVFTFSPVTQSFPPTQSPAPFLSESPRGSEFTLDQSFGQFFPATQAPVRSAPARAPAPALPPRVPVQAERFPQRVEPVQPTQQTFQPQPQQTFQAQPQQTFQAQQSFQAQPTSTQRN